MKVLLFIPSLDYNGAARQLLLLATGLPRDRFTVRVCTLGRATPWTHALHCGGVEIDVLSWNRFFDARPWLRLHGILADYRPDVLHAWRLPALWHGLMLGRWGGSRLLVSDFLPARARRLRLGPPDRWLLDSQVYRMTAAGAAEAERLGRLGVPAERIVHLPPGVAPPCPTVEAACSLRISLGLPPATRLLACVGPLERHKGFQDAVWALDILKFLYDDLHLVLIGAGPERPRLEQFARAIDAADRVHFVGCPPDAASLLTQADVVWVPSRTPSGLNTALEAMAAGRPVVASRLAGLAEVVAEGETGFLFPHGDKALLARRTRLLLDDPELRRRMGEAGRRRARDQYSVEGLIQRCGELYGA